MVILFGVKFIPLNLQLCVRTSALFNMAMCFPILHLDTLGPYKRYAYRVFN
jgi:hypothetical protein